MTLSPLICTWPMRPGGSSRSAASAMRTRQYGMGRPSETRTIASRSASGTGSTGSPGFMRWRLRASVRSGAPGGGKLTASEASASPYTGYIAFGKHHQVKADEAHVMGQGHPREAHVVLREAPHLGGAVVVGQEVAMREHDAFGFAGRAGGELDERRVPGRSLLHAAGARDVIEVIHQEG